MHLGFNKELLEEDCKLDRKDYHLLLQTRDLYNSCCCVDAERLISHNLISNEQRDLWERMLHFVKTPLYVLQEEREESEQVNE